MDERSLAEIAEAAVDTTPTITPQDFDFEGFLNGVRPTRRSVQLYPRGDLIARMDELVTMIEQADDDENVDDLIDEFEQVKDEFRKGVWFTVEKRTSEWAEKFRLDTEKRLGIKRTKKPDDDEATLSAEDATRISVHMLAEQIVIPSGVTPDSLTRLFEANEGEFNKLMYLMIKVNSELAENATGGDRESVLNKDFSRRRSGSQ